MSNIISTTEIIEQAVKSYAPVIVGEKQTTPEQHIAEIKAYCNGLTIVSINDKEGYKITSAALSKVKKIRTSIESKRKELKAVALEYGKAVDGEAKRLTALVEPIEAELKTKVDAIDKAIEQEREKERIRRNNAMIEAGFSLSGGLYFAGPFNYSIEQVQSASLESLEEILQRGRDEQTRVKAEQERIAKEREENARKAKELAEREARLKALEEQQNKTIDAATKKDLLSGNEGTVSMQGGPSPVQPTVVRNVGKVNVQPVGNIDPNTLNVNISEFDKGFNRCKTLILNRLNDPAPITRGQMVEFVNSLNPKF